MNWQEVCEYSSLQDLPFKIELNERGQIIMSPVKVLHSAYQSQLYFEQGAQEVWICNQQGEMSFYNPQGQLEKSTLVPDFPAIIEI